MMLSEIVTSSPLSICISVCYEPKYLVDGGVLRSKISSSQRRNKKRKIIPHGEANMVLETLIILYILRVNFYLSKNGRFEPFNKVFLKRYPPLCGTGTHHYAVQRYPPLFLFQ